VDVRALAIDGSWVFTPPQHRDSRGTFLEWFRAEALAELGHPFTTAQANQSVSRLGALRGVHFASVPPSQAKYVTCMSGQVLDCVVDIRPGSPTYGEHEAVLLDDVERHGVYLAEGLGHAFMALSENAVISYLCSTPYNPANEHGIDPLDPDLALPWPREITPLLSPKDSEAPSLKEAEAAGLLPTYRECLAFYEARRTQAGLGQ